jgi:hypothetical protein
MTLFFGSIQTTLDRYGHLMPKLHRAGASKLDRLMFVSEGAGLGAEKRPGR